jgi:nitrogenase molybdenum-iron protein alpha/beta subunit
MKLNTIVLGTALTVLLSTPIASIAGDDFNKAVKEATTEIDKAKAANYEWRDSRKILKSAEKAEKAGNHAEAMKLANKAKQQGIIAVAQAKQQKNAGPH